MSKEIENSEVLFYNGEEGHYEVLDFDPNGLTVKEVKEKVMLVMKSEYQLEWDEYKDVIYIINIDNLERLREMEE